MLRKAVLKLDVLFWYWLDVVKLNTANDTCKHCGTQGEKFLSGNETDQVRNERSDEVVTSREVK